MNLPSSTLTIVLLVPSWLLMLAITLVTLRRNDRQRLQIDALNETVEQCEADLAEGQQDYLSTLALLNQQHVRPSLEREAAAEKELLEVIALRDDYHEWADKLADAIAQLTGEDIGEHSSANHPWQNALDAAAEQLDRGSAEEPVEGFQVFPREPWKAGSIIQLAIYNSDGTVETRELKLDAVVDAPLSAPPDAVP